MYTVDPHTVYCSYAIWFTY